MRRRITEAIVGVAALILLLLGIPLALAVHHSVLDSEVVELQATAARTLTEIDLPLDSTQLVAVSGEPDAPPPFSVYDAGGALVFGDGPRVADAAVRRALAGNPASTTDGQIVVATPITNDTNERVVGVLRLTESLAGANHRARTAWLEMGGTALAALGLGWLVANRLARRLSRPVTDLAAAAARIGDGGGSIEQPPSSGVAEIDTLATALFDSSKRVHDALARERRFSADVSHQLRTPLTSLRLRLEKATDDTDCAAIEPALADLARVEETVEHLLAYARDSIPATSSVRLDVVVQGAAERWTERAVHRGRLLQVAASEPIRTRGSATSIEQILDVLVDNAIKHGRGGIVITERRIAGGAAVDVTDEGSSIEPDDGERIFHRGHGDHHGIGLALARSIAEAEGGRLVLAHHRPTTFSLILPHPEQYDEEC